MNGYKCVECQSLFPHDAILAYARRTHQKLEFMQCPTCGCDFTTGKFGQEFHGQQHSPSIRECSWVNPTTASPDDR